MKENLKKLKDFREIYELRRNEMAEKKAEFEKANEDLIGVINLFQEKITESEEEIRKEALVQYEKTGEKKLDFGVGIRIMKRLNYDPKQAFSWAREHSLALTLDKRAFEKIAKADNIEFVELTEEVMATIPKEINLEDE